MKKVIALALCLIVVFCLAGCSGSDQQEPEKKEYIKGSEISKAIKTPSDYEGKYIRISGQVSSIMNDDGGTYLQCYHDAENYKQEFIVEMTNDTNVDEDDFVNVDGKITGDFDYTTVMDVQQSALGIEGSVEVTTYEKSLGKALSTREVNKQETGHDVTLTVQKVEFAEDETRIYVNAKNNNSGDVSIYSFDASVVQDGKQIETYSNYLADDRPELDGLSGGAEKDAVLTFEKMDPDKEITLQMEASDNENYDWDYKFNITF